MVGKSARIVEATAVTYHEDMIDHVCLWDSNHPECPERFAEILKRCEALNLLNRCRYIPPRLAESEELLRQHSQELITLLKDCQTKTADELEEISSRYDSIFICSETYRLALFAAGSTIDLVKAVCNDEVKNGMAIVRPPGHHAMKSEFCGYCFFNNVALAADYALRTYNLSRILIVDWDVHHGQATQQMFYNDPRVVYFSIHRFDHGKFWPNLRESNSDAIGEGSGEGFNFNVPLNKLGLGNADYMAIFHQILLPVSVEFQPELIIVSAGFDPAVGCPEGEMEVTPACFAHFVNSLNHLANGKIAVVLEGGYFVKSLAEGAALSLRALLGDPCPQIEALQEIDESTRETILNVIYTHKRFWKCFQMHGTFPSSENSSSNMDYFHPIIKFEHVAEPLEKYPTRDCYPLRSEETIQFYTSWMNKLIRDTKLFETKYCCSCFSSCISKNYEHMESLKHSKSRIVNFTENSDLEANVFSVLDCITKHETKAAIIDASFLKLKPDNMFLENALISQAVSKFEYKRVVMVDINSKKNISGLTNANDGSVLLFSFNRLNADSQKLENDFNINFPWTAESFNDCDFLAAWFELVLPISYQFNPELIIISINFGEGSSCSLELNAFLIHWLTSLANGKIILIADYDSGNERESLSFSFCHKGLLGCPLPPLPKTKSVVSSNAINVMKTLTRRLGSRWTNLNFFVNFPEDTAH